MKTLFAAIAGLAAATFAEAHAQAGGQERFYGQERFTVVTSHTGRQTGVSTLHVRDWGRTRVEINDTSMKVMGFASKTKNRVIFNGARQTTVQDNGAATAMTNPLYDQIVAAMRGRTGVEFGKEIMTRMGGRPTGEKGNFAGHACDYWDVPSLGSKSCVTPWGATLHVTGAMAGIAIEQTATEVRIGDGGPDAAFVFDRSKVTEMPNLKDLLKRN